MIEEIIKAKNNDKQAIEKLLKKYEYIIQSKVTKFYVKGMEKDDLEQEASIAFLDAIKSYDNKKNDNFANFLSLCIDRRLITILTASQTQKNIPLNTSYSLDNKVFLNNESDVLLFDLLEIDEDTTEDTIIRKERMKQLRKETKKILSKFEQKVLEEYLQGYSYKEIAKKFNKNEKAIDNALQRVRSKIKK